MKKYCASVLLTIVMMTSFMINVWAAPAGKDISAGNLSTTNVTINGEVIEVPMLKSEVVPKAVGVASQSTETIFVPDFSMVTREENAEIIAKIRQRTVTDDSFTDNGQYILFSSTLAYNTSKYHGSDGYYYDLADLISFKISREIYSSAPFNGFKNATARALQVGPIDGPGASILDEIFAQEKDFGSVNFGSTYSVPTAWRGVIPGITAYNVGVQYEVEIMPASGRNYTIEHWHLVK